MEDKGYVEKGFLTEDHKIFYLEDTIPREIEYHVHSFDKLLVFFRGDIRYSVGGKTYALLPEDVILVPAGTPHKVTPGQRGDGYSRLVVYLSPAYLRSLQEGESSLRDCFCRAEELHLHVLRGRETGDTSLTGLAGALRDTVREDDRERFGALYRQALLQQFLILLDRRLGGSGMLWVDADRCNQKVADIIRYINSDPTSPISIDSLAEKFYLSKYHMMRQFKAETGYTIGGYITQKRLLRARALLIAGESVTKTCLDAGFRDHSTFFRAYRQMFGEAPSQTKEERYWRRE